PLGEADQGEVFRAGLEHPQVERQVAVDGSEDLGVEVREGGPVAGRVDDRVDLLLRAVDEEGAIAAQLGDVGPGEDVAVAETQEEIGGKGRLGLEEAVVGSGQAVAAGGPCEEADEAPGEA